MDVMGWEPVTKKQEATKQDTYDVNGWEPVAKEPQRTQVSQEMEEPSVLRQMAYGFESGENMGTDILDLIEITWGDGDGLVADEQWEGMSWQERRESYNKAKQADIDAKYQDVISQGYDDSWATTIGGWGKIFADPTMLLPGGTVVKGYKAASSARAMTKAARIAGTMHKYKTVSAIGGAYGGAANILNQLNKEGTVNLPEVAIVTATTAAVSPLLVAGTAKVGAAIGKAKHERVVGKVAGLETSAGKKIDDLSNKELRRIHNQMVDDLIEGQTTTAPTSLFDENVLALGTHQRAKEVSSIVTNKYANLLDTPENALKFEMRTGYKLPSIDKETAVHISKVRGEGPSAWRELIGKGARKVDEFVGGVDTRIGYLSKKVQGKIMRNDATVLKRTGDAEKKIDAIFGAKMFRRDSPINKVFGDAQARDDFTWLMFDQKWDEAFDAIKNSGASKEARDALYSAIDTVRYDMRNIGYEAVDVGLINSGAGKFAVGKAQVPQAKYRKGFFPHRVKDLEGLKQRMGEMGQDSYLETARNEIRQKLGLQVSTPSKSGAKLEEFYERQAVQKAIRMANGPKFVKLPDSSKVRQIEVVPKWAREYYHTPEDGLRMYFREMVEEVETRKLLGINTKDTEWLDKATAMKLQDQDSLLNSLLDASENLSATQQDELFNLINIRYGPGRRHSARWVSNAKSIVYATLLGNVVSAAQQIGDLGVSLVVNGYMPTLKAIAHRSGAAVKRGAGKAIGKEMKTHFNVMEEGVASAAHDIASGGLHRNLTRVMKYSGFTGTDRVMKNITSEAAVIKAMKQVKRQGGANKIYQKYGQYWGNDDTMALIKDLRGWKRGQEFTPRMKEFAVTELMELQPVAKTALPQAYLEHPDGRLFYTLLTWQLRFLDLGRRRAMDEIRKGNVASGIKNLAYLGFTVGTMDAGVNYVQEWMKGRETRIEDFPVEAMKSTASLFMVNRYGKQGSGAIFSNTAEGVMPTVFPDTLDTIASPFVKPLTDEDGWKAGLKEGLTDWVSIVPLGGKVVAGRMQADDFNRKKLKEWENADKKVREREPSDAQKELQQRMDKRRKDIELRRLMRKYGQ